MERTPLAQRQSRPAIHREINIGMAGTGGIARIHRSAIESLSGARISAVWSSRGHVDTNWPTATEAKSYRELLAIRDLDVVCISTMSGTHASLAMEALEAGKHVIVEKPIALSLHEAQHLVTFAQEHELLAVGIAQARYELQIGEVVRLAHAGELGQPIIAEALIRWHRDDLYYASSPWRGSWEGSGGVLANQGYHMVDLMCWAFGSADVVHAIQESLTHRIRAADTAVASIKFKAGGLGVISASTSAYPGTPEALNLFFDRGFVRFEGGKIVEWSFAGLEEPAGGRTLGSGASDPLAIGSSGHGNQWADIIQALQRGIDPRFTAVDTLPAIALLEAARGVAAS